MSSSQEFHLHDDFGCFMRKNQPTNTFIPKLNQNYLKLVMFKCEQKVVRKFAFEIEKLMHSA